MHDFVDEFFPKVCVGGRWVVDTFESGIGVAEIAHDAEGLACRVALGGGSVVFDEIGVYA